ncbi:MAG: ATP-dependent Clp protease ATP-binding subunit [Patescibacteria group bacterium]|jgi:ATP-dependent Clp protease ATP-binding subunit ClpC
MKQLPPPVAIVCSACGGDPQRSLTCKICGGAGIGVASPDGFLVWSQRVDAFTIAFRKLTVKVNAVVHVSLMIACLAGLGFFLFHLLQLEDLSSLSSLTFWTSGHPALTWLWISCFLACFLIFRLFEYTSDRKNLPNWGMSVRDAEQMDAKSAEKANHRFEIEPFFSEEALSVVNAAYQVAQDLKRSSVEPSMLFAAALTTGSGGLFMTRLGMPFDKVKGPLARLMSEAPPGDGPILLSKETKRTLALAYATSRVERRKNVEVMEIFLQAFKDSPRLQEVLDQLGFPAEHIIRVTEWIRLQEKMRDDHRRFVALAMLKPSSVMNRAMTAQQTPLLDRFSEDLTIAARNGYLAPLVGREREMQSLLQAIESGRRSVVLVGETGSGKSALIEEMARRMVEEDVPPELFDRRLVSVNIAQVVAAGEPGLAAERLLAMLHEIAMSGNVILAVQGIESLVGGGSGPMDLAEAFASELSKGYFIAIATTTPSAWTQYLERRTLGAKLVKVAVPALDIEGALKVLMAKSRLIEYQNKVFFSYAALDKASSLATRYIHDVASPENALDVIREAAVYARKERGEKTLVTAEDVAHVIREKTGIPLESVTQDERAKLLNLEEKMHGRVIGQEEAVTAVSQAMRRARAELREGRRPIANFLFLGPTGVGKTELAKTLAVEYFNSEASMTRLDMSEYQDSSSVARMIGAAGDQRGGLLTEAVRKTPYTIVLLDEIEKAHPDILNLFLQVMDDGRLTDGVGRTVDFTNAVVIMTSNAGTPFIQEAVKEGISTDVIKTTLIERELKGIFRPEFLNRFDGIIVFKPLSMEDVTQIAWLMINGVGAQLEKKGIQFRAEDEAVEVLAKAGYDPQFGARPLRRVIQDRVDNALADLLLKDEIGRRDTVVLQADGTLRVEKAPPV